MTKNDEKVWFVLRQTLADLKINRPNDRSDKDRRYAVMITEMEKIVAYCSLYLMTDGVQFSVSTEN